MPIYIINLSSNPERRLYVKRQLDSFGLKYQFMDMDFLDKYRLESKAYRAHIAELLEIDAQALEKTYAMFGKDRGSLVVALSHIKIYHLMAKHNHSEVCILEDDVTLLPAFPEILKIAPDLSWDILQLAHMPIGGAWSMLRSCTYQRERFIGKKGMFLSCLQCWIKNHNDVDQQVLKAYGFDNRLYSEQAKYIKKTIQRYRYLYRSKLVLKSARLIMDAIMGHSAQSIDMIKEYYDSLLYHFAMQLGVLPKKADLNFITKDNCIAEPSARLSSTMAYIVRPAAAVKWEQCLFAKSMVIDDIPWCLHQNGQVKLRIITPPCAIATQIYIKHSVRRHR